MDYLQLKKENDLLLKIIDSSYDGIFITDNHGITLYCNEAYLRISGLTKEQIMGYQMTELIAQKLIPDACSPEVIKTLKPVTKIIDYYGGTSALVTSIPIFDESGQLIRVFSNVRDITDLIKLREQLKNTSELNIEYQRQLWRESKENQVLAHSQIMRNILRLALRVSQVTSPVLIQGESGVGKDVLARYIHDAGDLSGGRPFIHINCSAIPETLLESELFGYEPGAFTGASRTGKMGMFELAHNGTLFLDEIGEIPASTQVKLLDVLQSNRIYRLGGTQTIPINTRIIAATNSNLEQLIQEKRFRRDLYYRLNVIPVFIPPLRERREDISPLIFHFLEINNQKYGFNKKITPATLELLLEYSWPGNVRELKNVIERMIVLADSDIIDEKCVPNYIKEASPHKIFIDTPDHFDSYDLKTILDGVEREVIKKAIASQGSLRKAARCLGIDLSTLVRKKKKLGV